MNEFAKIILYFTIFSVAGYIWETIFCAVCYKKVRDRGFLFGPYCPIYGFGGLLIMLFSNFARENPLLAFITIVAVCSTLEYTTSYVLEKLFNIRWWYYSDIEKVNLNGRIGLLSSLSFGFVGCGFIYFVEPTLTTFINSLPVPLVVALGLALLGIFILDTIFSTYAARKASHMDNDIKGQKDQTAHAKKNQRTAIKNLVSRKP